MLILSFLCSVHAVKGQTFPGEAGALIPPGAPGVTIGLTTATCTVYGVGIIGQGCTKLDHLALDITHTYTGDLGIFLISPGGDVLELTSGNGGTGNNFTATVFTDTTSLFITQGAAPYTGNWRPEGRQQSLTLPYPNTNPLGTYTFENVFDGVNADGEWTLYINDFLLVDVGVINSWSITFTGGQGPVPEVDLGPDVVICEELSTTLIADVTPGADTWEWSTGESTPSITVNPTESTTYMVTVTNNGCMDTASVTVEVQPNMINADAGQDEEICEGFSADLNASGGVPGAMFEWSNGQSGSSITVSPGVTTLYTLTVSDGICSGTDEVEITVNPTPIADAGPPMTMCDGMSAELTASGGTQNSDYAWSTGQHAESIVVSPYVTTTYTVTVTIDGCEDEDEVEVTVIPAPEVDAGDDETICLGQSTLLTATGFGTDYEWSTGQTGTEISVSPITTTTYTVSLTEAGCTSSDEVEVEVIDVIAAVSPDMSVCEGDTVMLTATGGTTYLWSTGQTNAFVVVSPQDTTIYTVTVSQGICSDVAAVQVNVSPSPIVEVTGIDEICAGDTTTLTASGAISYQWSTGASGPAISITPMLTTLYIVTVSDPGCTAVDSLLITVHPLPAISLGLPLTICAGDTVMLQVAGLSGNEALIWNTGDTATVIDVAPLSDAVYSVTVTDPFGCSAESNGMITVLPTPQANAGNDVFIMTGDMITLSASGTGSYLWSTGETTADVVVSPVMTTTYSLTVTLNGCADVDEVTVFVNEVPPVDLGSDISICPGETVTLDATVPGPFMLAYQWSTGETGSSINVAPLADALYIITVTDMVSGFFSIDSISVFVGSLPLGQPVITGPAEGCLNGVDAYVASGVTGATSYTWMVSGGIILTGQGTQSVNVSWSGTGMQSLVLLVSNDCGTLPAVTFNTDILTVPLLIGPISGIIDPCVFATSLYSIPVLPGASYNWSITGGGVITSGQGTTVISVDWNGALAASICVEAVNLCGVSSPVCLDIVPAQSPVISAGPDLETCDQVLTLEGSGGGRWEVLSGNGMLNINNPTDPVTTVMTLSPGTYVLVYESGASGCEVSDTTVITFYTSPSVSQLIEICDSDLLSYTVSFQIINGQPPYRVNGSLLTGNTFVSDPIAAGFPYLFQVGDDHGCLSPLIMGEQSCECYSTAGLMDTSQVYLCLGDSLFGSYPFGDITGPGDTIAFILHDGQLPDGILAWSFQPVFPFLSSFHAGTTYYMAAVVGPKGTGGFPDPADPCFAWSAGTPFLIFEPPVMDLQPLDTIGCDPAMIQLDIGGSASGITYQYAWTASDGGIILGDTDSTTIIAGNAGTYSLTIQDSFSGCSSTGDIVVAEAPPLTVDLGPDKTVHPGESVQLEASGPAGIQFYNWFAADTCTGCPVIFVQPEVTTLYQVEVQDDQGCTAFDEVLVTVQLSKEIFLPNVFSPNGDQVNDELYIPAHPALLNISRFEIFDRWGNIVFRASDTFPESEGSKWNGTFHQTVLNPGVFTCIAEVEFRDGTTQHLVWDATLIR